MHSFDLVSPNPLVTACDMANVPIKNASVHVAVFCLSLMGTNLADFLREAHRVLVPGGLVKVCSVRFHVMCGRKEDASAIFGFFVASC